MNLYLFYTFIYVRRTRDIFQINMVEAVYSCIIKKTVSKDMQDDLVELLRKNAYMFLDGCYIVGVRYTQYDDHLPKKYTT